MADFAAEICEVSHAYRSHQALKDVSFAVKEHAFFGLLGPNGSGKTTLFRIMSSLLAPDQGHSTIMGHDTVRSPNNVRINLGVVFQQPSLDEALTIHQNLLFHGALYGMDKASLKDRIALLSNRLQIQDRLHSRVSRLSGGLKRRADLVRGLLHQPRLLLLDEPTTGLDPIARHDFWHLLSSIRKEEGITMILATHLLDEAEDCDEVVIMDSGSTAISGNPVALRKTLGEKVLWLTSTDTALLAQRIEDEFGFKTSEIDGSICIKEDKALESIPALYHALQDLIESYTVRNPTLEDVFLMYANRSFAPINQSAAALQKDH